jgi:hypothetical protein
MSANCANNEWNKKDLASKRNARALRATLSLAIAMNFVATPKGTRLIDAQRGI